MALLLQSIDQTVYPSVRCDRSRSFDTRLVGTGNVQVATRSVLAASSGLPCAALSKDGGALQKRWIMRLAQVRGLSGYIVLMEVGEAVGR